MEAQNGVHVEDKKCVTENGIGEKPAVEELAMDCADTDEQNAVTDEKVSESNVVPKNASKSEGVKGSKIKSGGPKGSKNGLDTEVSKPSKVCPFCLSFASFPLIDAFGAFKLVGIDLRFITYSCDFRNLLRRVI